MGNGAATPTTATPTSGHFEGALLKNKNLGQDILPSPGQPKRTESLYVAPARGSAASGGSGGGAGIKVSLVYIFFFFRIAFTFLQSLVHDHFTTLLTSFKYPHPDPVTTNDSGSGCRNTKFPQKLRPVSSPLIRRRWMHRSLFLT